jgi:hypothetical protein
MCNAWPNYVHMSLQCFSNYWGYVFLIKFVFLTICRWNVNMFMLVLNSNSLFLFRNKSQSYFTTGGLPPFSSSWRRAPWDSRPELFFSLKWTPLWWEDGSCHLQLLLVLASAFILGSESRVTRDHTLLSQIRDFPFSRHLWPAGLRWRYSTPSSHVNVQ